MSASNTESKFQNTAYCQVPSASLSRIEAPAGSFRLSIKEGKFDVYLLWPLGKCWFPYYKHAIILVYSKVFIVWHSN